MSETDERMNVGQKMQLGAQHQELNGLLVQIKSINDEINEHMKAISALRIRATELEHQFHKRAIEVAPTQIVEFRPKSTKAPVDKQTDELVKKLSKMNLKPEQLRSLIQSLSKDWEDET